MSDIAKSTEQERHEGEGRPIHYGDFVLPRSAPGYFVYLFLVVDPAIAEDVPRVGFFHVQVVFPEYHTPPGFEYMSEDQQRSILKQLSQVMLVPTHSVVHHEDAGLILMTQEAKRTLFGIGAGAPVDVSSMIGESPLPGGMETVQNDGSEPPASTFSPLFPHYQATPAMGMGADPTNPREQSGIDLNNHDLS